jgi:RNA polymerase sigma-70 factor, ECF subfamily
LSLAKVTKHNLDSPALVQTIRRAHDGDHTALESIYRLHRRHVYGICLRMVRDPVKAEDLVQESFALVCRKIHTFRGDAAFSTWLYRLTTNVVLMSFRRDEPKCASLEDVTTATDDREQIGGALDTHASDPIDRISLQTAIEGLPAKSKAAFILHDVQGYRHREIAKILRCSVGNSKAQLHRARERLRTMLRDTRRNPAKSR